jgi:hypothetical protein
MTNEEDKNMLSRIAKIAVRYVPDTLVEAYLLGFEQGLRDVATILESVPTVRIQEEDS